jgi:hypothetical protein
MIALLIALPIACKPDPELPFATVDLPAVLQ